MQTGKDDRPIWHGELVATRLVAAPRRIEGVGQALRAAYLPRRPELPDSMVALLDKLR